MVNVANLVNSYVAVWNEPNADERRRKIRSLWAPEGTTCYRLLDARGYEAIEARVTGSWDKWLREGKYVFRPHDSVCHNDVVKCGWEMVTVPGGEVEAAGLSFLVLSSDGRIRHDYQFNPAANEASELVERYLAVLNEPSADVRRNRIGELWAPDGMFVSKASTRNGYAAIEAETAAAHDAYVAKGFRFLSASSSQNHHNLVKLSWLMRAEDTGEMAAAGSDLLILDQDGRIRFDYRYDEPV